MDLRDAIIVLALEAELERKREENRRMKELLSAAQLEFQKKVKECEMLKRKKQDMVTNEAANQKLVHEFMLFIDAIDKDGDGKIAQTLDEKAMMNTILAVMNGGGDNSGDTGGFSVKDGKREA
ncbi:uncharacterized protein LOC120117900 [Hibiscus syriacus]|uniref:uncharacterized protein LOC120117900 n=1 Tax=Hibiscus syriacus TaxID=106335 RepID=UPI0019230186|nr:uncharacterized protein LOC120117900 [Hibiscus syriacus]